MGMCEIEDTKLALWHVKISSFTSALKRETAIVEIGDLDYSVRDVAFECFVLSRYDNFKKRQSYVYLYAQETDKGGTIKNKHYIEWNV